MPNPQYTHDHIKTNLYNGNLTQDLILPKHILKSFSIEGRILRDLIDDIS